MKRTILAVLIAAASIGAHAEPDANRCDPGYTGRYVCPGRDEAATARLIAANDRQRAADAKLIRETKVIDPYHTSYSLAHRRGQYQQSGETVDAHTWDSNGNQIN